MSSYSITGLTSAQSLRAKALLISLVVLDHDFAVDQPDEFPLKDFLSVLRAVEMNFHHLALRFFKIAVALERPVHAGGEISR